MCLSAAPASGPVHPVQMDTSSDASASPSAHKRARDTPKSAAGTEQSEETKAKRSKATDSHAEQPAKPHGERTPTATMDDDSDQPLFSSLSFEQVLQLKHVDVVARVAGSEVRLWRVCELTPHPDTQRFTVRLHEWPSITLTVPPNRLQKHNIVHACV
jgi:hypothetical protein